MFINIFHWVIIDSIRFCSWPVLVKVFKGLGLTRVTCFVFNWATFHYYVNVVALPFTQLESMRRLICVPIWLTSPLSLICRRLAAFRLHLYCTELAGYLFYRFWHYPIQNAVKARAIVWSLFYSCSTSNSCWQLELFAGFILIIHSLFFYTIWTIF